MKFLVDECLSPELVKLAHNRGHGESSHVVWRNLQGKKDRELKPIILDGDWTFVTRNSVDFRGPSSRPGSRGQYVDVEIHAGLVCLNGPDGMDLDVQI
jgi:predicted nuclease of predicted toxin-antitoxin system